MSWNFTHSCLRAFVTSRPHDLGFNNRSHLLTASDVVILQLITIVLSCVVTTIQNSTRARQSASLVTREERYDASPNSTSSSSSQHLAPSFRNPWQPCGGRLIANPRLESRLSSNSRSQLQISNRERMAICRFTPSSRPALFRLSLATRQWLVLGRPRVNWGSLPTTFLIVTPRLESSATPTKQNTNPISGNNILD